MLVSSCKKEMRDQMIYVVLQKNLMTGYTCVAGVYDSEALAEQKMEVWAADGLNSNYAYEIDYAFLEEK